MMTGFKLDERSKPRILVVDDTESNRYALTRYLRQAGFEAWEAENGRKALELAEKSPDLIVLDVKLPDVLGHDVCRVLKKERKTASIPVLEISAGLDSSSDKVAALEAGADGYLSGTVTPGELLANVKMLLRLRDAQEALRESELRYRQQAAQLEQAQVELRKHTSELEKRVHERTSELGKTNEKLRREMSDRRRAEENRESLLRQLVNAQEEQRRRISRELHDEMGQDLTALSLGLKVLEKTSQEGQEPEILARLEKLANEMGEKLHWIALELRPSALDDFGLPDALRNYLRSWSERFHIDAHFEVTGYNGELSTEAETVLYRTVQEALNNVVKHAKANRVSVVLERLEETVQVIVEDNGCGFDPQQAMNPQLSSNRLGLLGMNERLGFLAGTLKIESSPGGGTTVFGRIRSTHGRQN